MNSILEYAELRSLEINWFNTIHGRWESASPADIKSMQAIVKKQRTINNKLIKIIQSLSNPQPVAESFVQNAGTESFVQNAGTESFVQNAGAESFVGADASVQTTEAQDHPMPVDEVDLVATPCPDFLKTQAHNYFPSVEDGTSS
jgi:hypothetical protein